MASEVDIANLALAHLGDDAQVASFDPPEGGPQADHCARFYPIARDTLLEMHAWSFATRTAALTALGTAPDGWSYSYALPNGCLKPLRVYPPGGRQDLDALPFEVEVLADGQPVLLTDCPDATLRFVSRITDTARFSLLAVEALSWLLASMLAGPVIKGDTGAAAAKSCYQVFLSRFADATSADANKSRVRLDPQPAWITGR